MTVTVGIQEERPRAAAVEYIRQRLVEGRSMAKLLLGAVDFRSGEIVALSAVPLRAEDVVEYGWGHARLTGTRPTYVQVGERTCAAYPVPSAREPLCDVIQRCLDDGAGVCLLENDVFDASAPWLARAKSRLLFHGDEVYHALLSADRDKARIMDAIREAERPPVFVGAVGRVPWPSGTDATSLHTLTDAQLSDFAKAARCVFVGAYDGEGYLIWKKAG